MTINELLAMPKGIQIEEYQSLLEKKSKLLNKCQKLSRKIEDEQDSLDILKDEVGSTRFLRHKALLEKYTKQIDNCLKEYNQIEKKVRGN